MNSAIEFIGGNVVFYNGSHEKQGPAILATGYSAAGLFPGELWNAWCRQSKSLIRKEISLIKGRFMVLQPIFGPVFWL
jgi:hypothetical protein